MLNANTPFRMHSWDLCVQNVWAITVFKSSWPIPSLFVLLSSRGGSSSRKTKCSSSSDWKRSLQSDCQCFRYISDAHKLLLKWVDAIFFSRREHWIDMVRCVGEVGTSEQLWEEYFADPSWWWDNRVHKVHLLPCCRYKDWSNNWSHNVLLVSGFRHLVKHLGFNLCFASVEVEWRWLNHHSGKYIVPWLLGAD